MINSCKIPVTAKTRIGFDNVENLKPVISKGVSDSAALDNCL